MKFLALTLSLLVLAGLAFSSITDKSKTAKVTIPPSIAQNAKHQDITKNSQQEKINQPDQIRKKRDTHTKKIIIPEFKVLTTKEAKQASSPANKLFIKDVTTTAIKFPPTNPDEYGNEGNGDLLEYQAQSIGEFIPVTSNTFFPKKIYSKGNAIVDSNKTLENLKLDLERYTEGDNIKGDYISIEIGEFIPVKHKLFSDDSLSNINNFEANEIGEYIPIENELNITPH